MKPKQIKYSIVGSYVYLSRLLDLQRRALPPQVRRDGVFIAVAELAVILHGHEAAKVVALECNKLSRTCVVLRSDRELSASCECTADVQYDRM